MTAITYQQCYRILQVRSDCEWEALRLAYRRRVRLCHPDLVDGSGGRRDDEFKQVVFAYRVLARFRLQHGELPPPWLLVDDDASSINIPARSLQKCRTDEAAPDKRESSKSRRLFPWRPMPFHLAVFTAFVSGVGTAAIVDRIYANTSGESPPANGELAMGMNPESVVDVQGIPTHTKGSVWFYGDSGIIFDEGCVVGWENQPPFPLRTMINMAYLDGYPPNRGADRDCIKAQ